MDLEAASTPENKMVFAAAVAAEADVPVDYVTVDVEVASRRRKLSAGILVTFFIEIPASANIQVADVTASLGASDSTTFTGALQTAAADLGQTADFDQVQTTTIAPVVTYTQTPQPTPAPQPPTQQNATIPVADAAAAKTFLSVAAFFGLLLAF